LDLRIGVWIKASSSTRHGHRLIFYSFIFVFEASQFFQGCGIETDLAVPQIRQQPLDDTPRAPDFSMCVFGPQGVQLVIIKSS
jgi:hypothetical protein